MYAENYKAVLSKQKLDIPRGAKSIFMDKKKYRGLIYETAKILDKKGLILVYQNKKLMVASKKTKRWIVAPGYAPEDFCIWMDGFVKGSRNKSMIKWT